jgi:very-short-patch-repair endonuclease
MPELISLHTSVAPVLSFAMHQASVPVVGELRLVNASGQTVDGVTVILSCDPPVIGSRQWTFDRIAAGSEVAASDRAVTLDGGMLYKLSERIRATVTIQVMQGDLQLATFQQEVVALSRHEWSGSIRTPELLAAFVTPNDPGIAEVLRSASDKLRESGRDPALNGYQSESRERVWELAAAIWTAVASRRLIYAEPPASFERVGQKVRLPSEVLNGRLATCLDTAVLFAAALEQIGLRPLLCLTKGHAMTALWLQPSTLLGVTTEEPSDLRKYIGLKELILFETTAITSNPPASFSQALDLGTRRVREELDQDFVLALDIRQARARQVTPLPIEIETIDAGQPVLGISPALETPPALPPIDKHRPDDDVPDTPQGRLDAWKRRLLDLTKRNRLLNLRKSKTAIRLVAANVGQLEDILADNGKITIVPLETLAGRGGGRDEEHLRVQRGIDFELELARQALENGQVPARHSEAELKAGIVELFRKAKSDMEEGGANTLFLAIGMLKWREADTSATWHRAPLLLVPVKLDRSTAASPPRLTQHPDETVFNMTLLEMLRQDFNLRIPQLESALPRDTSGVDVARVLAIVRAAIRDIPGWDVLNETVLSTFSFAKYLMWKDLNDHADALRGAPFVKHMIDSPRDIYSRTPSFIHARDQDARIDPASLFTPLTCDSSQVAAIYASGQDGDFVLEGPPGTGKSQTIANLIAHNLGLGRKVLFVAEKMTALSVVYDRLKKVGLGDFCLELHSSRANRKDVLAQLDRAWTNRDEKSAESWSREAQQLRGVRDGLNGLVEALHTPAHTGMSPRDAIARASSSRFAESIQLDWDKRLDADLAGDADGLVRLRSLARELGQAFGQVGPGDATDFADVQHADWSYQWQGQITAAAVTLVAAIDAAEKSVGRLLELTSLPGAADTVEDVSRLAEFASTLPIAARFDLDAMLAPDARDVSEQLRKAVALLADCKSIASSLSTPCDLTRISRPSVTAVRKAWEEANARVWPLSVFARGKVSADAARRFDTAAPPDLNTDLARLDAFVALKAELDRVTERLPSSALWRGLKTDPESVNELLCAGEAARASIGKLAGSATALPEVRQTVRVLFVDGRELLQPGMPTAVAGEALVTAASQLTRSVDAFRALAGKQLDASTSLPQLRERASAVADKASRLNAWCRWQDKRVQVVSVGLGALAAGLESGLITPKDTVAAFDVSYARWLAPLLIDSRPPLVKFSAIEHEHLLNTFRALDERLLGLAAQTVRASASAIVPRKSDSDAIPGFGVLRREVQNAKGKTPVRQLISQMGDALTRLTPCLMMSPHSVAQFLGTETAKFDLVVFDEASQIAVWDAIGAIARGKNAIIVGDPKQMPPTNFFGRSADGDEDDGVSIGGTNVGDLESILDEGLATGMHHHRLTGHYRSQHESLIAFSNHRYYGGALVTYPSAATLTTAVTFRRCDGAYQMGGARTNPEEAKALVCEIVTRLSDPARRAQTIGVVTMNAEQQRLIRNLLDDERRKRPALEAAFRDSAGEEVEMVYNLETVQGHERDVIMLSVGYGPTVAGSRDMSMNFGPLNKLGGERRLNVAITRAIREVVVFASFDPEMIDLTRTASQAIRDLKAYLDFAKRGPIALAREATFAGGVDTFDSQFEEHVATRLRTKGWTVQTQVGVSKFRIDLGIVHPDEPGRFLAGVECDGATFHSSPTARDRDRVRHAVLTALGWQLVRLWSTDFFLDPDAAMQRVHDSLTDLLASDRVTGASSVVESAEERELQDDTDDAPDERSSDFVDEVIADEEDVTDDRVVEPVSGIALPEYRPVAQVGPRRAPSPTVDSPDTCVAPLRNFAPQFYDDAYLKTLRPVCLGMIDRAGPMTFVHLAERIARAHGFQRTGSEIKKRVWAAVGRQRKNSAAPDGAKTFWPESQLPVSHVPYRGDVIDGVRRPWEATPYVEKLGLAVEIARSFPPQDRLGIMTARLSIGRLRAKTRDELVELLESAGGSQD